MYYVFINENNSFEIINYIGILISCIGIFGEAFADYQLQHWKNNKKPEEKTFRGGLFKNSRHPNLFFELVYWFGMSCYGIKTDDLNTLCAFIGPFFLWVIMYFVTIPITTNHMKKSRPNYEAVISKTNIFIPFY